MNMEQTRKLQWSLKEIKFGRERLQSELTDLKSFCLEYKDHLKEDDLENLQEAIDNLENAICNGLLDALYALRAILAKYEHCQRTLKIVFEEESIYPDERVDLKEV